MHSQKIAANQATNQQAFEAAQAGLDVGMPYLEQNSATIVANPVSGLIAPYTDNNIQNIALTNNSRYTITYTNPVAANYNLLKVSVTGSDANNVASKTISQQAQFSSLLPTTPTLPLTTKGDLRLAGNATITNLESNNTIRTGGDVDIDGDAVTIIQAGVGSDKNHIGSDIQENVSAIDNQSADTLFNSYFGVSTTMMKNQVANYYENDSNTNYTDTIAGKVGTSIWIEQTEGKAKIKGDATIGSPTQPVLLIINGGAKFSGDVTIYGLVYLIGSSEVNINLRGHLTVVGGVITSDELRIGGSADIIYSSTVLNNLKNNVLINYNKVPGSWKDF
jgi:hypothetical protein